MAKLLRTLTVIAGITAIGLTGVACGSADNGTTASVVRVIDGDTFIADINGTEKRIRLLNVDTPELSGEDGEAECMAVEARDFLESKLPQGSSVELFYDQEKQDHYGRELTAVYASDDLINETIAGEGFGVAVSYEPNTTYYDRVAEAEESARKAGQGIHSDSLDCTVAHRLEQIAAEVDSSSAAVLTALTAAQLADQLTEQESYLKKLLLLQKVIKQPSDFAKVAYASYATEKTQLDELIKMTELRISEIEEVHADKLEQEEEERREQERLEQEAQEKEQRREQEAQAQVAREQAAREEQRRATQRASQPAPAPTRSAPSLDNYTGCRAYGGNYIMNSVDAQGRSYAKIDCTTRVQIG